MRNHSVKFKCTLYDKVCAPRATIAGAGRVLSSTQAPQAIQTDCNTDEVHRRTEEGGWVVAYAKRQWDYELGATIVGSFFPATAALAAEHLQEMIKTHTERAAEALAQVGKQAGVGMPCMTHAMDDPRPITT